MKNFHDCFALYKDRKNIRSFMIEKWYHRAFPFLFQVPKGQGNFNLISDNILALYEYLGNHQKATALMIAAKRGEVSLVKHLLENGADIHATDMHGRYAFDYASTPDIKPLLLDTELSLDWLLFFNVFSSEKVKDELNRFRLNKPDTYNAILEIQDKWNPFQFACEQGLIEIAGQMIKNDPSLLKQVKSIDQKAPIWEHQDAKDILFEKMQILTLNMFLRPPLIHSGYSDFKNVYEFISCIEDYKDCLI